MGAGRTSSRNKVPAIARYKPTADQENVFMPPNSSFIDEFSQNTLLQQQQDRAKQYASVVGQQQQQNFNPVEFNVPDIRRNFREEIPEWVSAPDKNLFRSQAFTSITNPITGETFNAPTGGYQLNKDYFDNNNPDIEIPRKTRKPQPRAIKEFLDEYTNKPAQIADDDIRLTDMLSLNTTPVETKRGSFY